MQSQGDASASPALLVILYLVHNSVVKLSLNNDAGRGVRKNRNVGRDA